MNSINYKLRMYVENNIFPIYEKNDSGHGIEHINYVIKRSLEFAKQFDNIDLDMVYVIASFHDLAHHIDRNNHEVLSAKLFYENEEMKKFFTDEQRAIIKEAIEDHRASLEHEPRSNYGKIISSADRSVDIVSSLKRTHAYTIKHYPDMNLDDMINRAYEHISKKFGINGYAKTYCYDKEFENLKKDVEELLKDKYKFALKYLEVNEIMDVKEKNKTFSSDLVELTDEMKQMPISKLIEKGMSKDSFETLCKMGIYTLGELLSTKTDIIYHATTKTSYYSGYWAIRKAVMDMGLFFNDDHLKWESLGISDEIAMVRINNLDLSPRLKNALIKKGDLIYLGDLLTTDYEDVKHIRVIGEEGIIELKNYIHSLGFSLPNEKPTMKELKESFKEKGIPMVGETLNLDGQVSGVLYKNGIYTLEDLINFGPKVYELIGIGDVKKKKLSEALKARNIELGASIVLPAETPFAIRPTEIIVNRAKEENESIKKRIDTKEKLLAEYEKLMEERSNLIAREQKLDEEIAAKVVQLSSMQKEEVSSYGRK